MTKWKDIKWYEKLYIVWNHWWVYSCPKKWKWGHNWLFMKPSINWNWYYQLVLRKNWKPKTFRIHKLVAEAFISNPENKKTINHKNWDKLNNAVKNLEWNTYSENHLHRYRELWHKWAALWKFWKVHNRSVWIKQYNKDWHLMRTWDSIADVERELWIAHSNIVKVCQWYRRTAGW